jgi:ketosteroid isomerase-like protein
MSSRSDPLQFILGHAQVAQPIHGQYFAYRRCGTAEAISGTRTGRSSRDTWRRMPEEPTTSDLVERVHRLFEAANRRDVDTVMSFFHPDAVWEGDWLGTNFEGVTAIRGFVEDWTGAYEDWETKVEEVTDLGNGVTFGVHTQKGRPVASTGDYVRLRGAAVAAWAAGRIVRITFYADIEEARAAAQGLAESRA